MISALNEWPPRGKFMRLSPCGKYKVQLVAVAGRHVYYAYPQKGGLKLGGPFETSAEAWACCAEADQKVAA